MKTIFFALSAILILASNAGAETDFSERQQAYQQRTQQQNEIQAQRLANQWRAERIREIAKFGARHSGFASEPTCYLFTASYGNRNARYNIWQGADPEQRICAGGFCVKAIGSLDPRWNLFSPARTQINYCHVKLKNGLACSIGIDALREPSGKFVAHTCFDAAGKPRRL